MSDAQPFSPINDPALLHSPLFTGMSELEYNAIAAFLERRHIPNGQTVFKEGDPGEDMYILLSGKLSAYVSQSDGTQRWMFEIKPGDFFGEMSIIAGETRSATLTAKEETVIMVLQGIDFYRIVFEYPMIGIKLLTAICHIQTTWLNQSSKHLGDLTRWGESARRRAITDELTGLYNRRFLEESIKDRFEHGSVGIRIMSFLMLDLDRIHEINDRHGPPAGDKVFVVVAEILRSCTRSGDICARLAGDEFAILLPDTAETEAMNIAERIRETIANCKVSVPRTPDVVDKIEIEIHTSIGISVAPKYASGCEGLFLSTDSALRKAKDMGRNRVELAG
ncbi:GGDEF domain-containing protein [Leadbettera azotonutricia]|uniref:diguanylate cyclase n=1 Tax=Leadbettera azotonutricia (strain ATCC BAA-888 / DSM 13862 / ZAS-9) TaxID=545695 RepID=F5YEC9_LEAAZ|nr:GGDEF domain-containing protein [Leadbettera azotonutricia]AEF81899.1 diguanylate cyclase with GAF sensor [Leadbettera azotonutricia ZAS-9]